MSFIQPSENTPEDKIPVTEKHDHDFNPIEVCDRLVKSWVDAPVIRYGQTQAAYAPLRDEILMPDPRSFFEDEKFYSVIFHEMGAAYLCGINGIENTTIDNNAATFKAG